MRRKSNLPERIASIMQALSLPKALACMITARAHMMAMSTRCSAPDTSAGSSDHQGLGRCVIRAGRILTGATFAVASAASMSDNSAPAETTIRPE